MPRATLVTADCPARLFCNSFKALSTLLEYYGLKEGDTIHAQHTNQSDPKNYKISKREGGLGIPGMCCFKWIEHPRLPSHTFNLPDMNKDDCIDTSTWPPSLSNTNEQTASCSPTPEATQGPPPMKTIARSVIARKAAPTEKDPGTTVEITLEGPTLLNEDSGARSPSTQDWIMKNVDLIKEKGAIPSTIQILTTVIPVSELTST